MLTLIPAYGRDYTSKAKVAADLAAGKDFQIASYGPECGRYATAAELKAAGHLAVFVRFHASRKIQRFAL